MDGQATHAPPSSSTIWKAIIAAGLGNAVEWFDFALYGYLATGYIEKVLLPASTSATIKGLEVWGIFAVSFLIRPLGSIVLGPLGDRIGRKAVLSMTIIAMCVGTAGLGLIPPYATIGMWAPVLLILVRLIQGFSTGGEYAGAATFIAEYAPNKRRGFLGSFLEAGTYVGFILGSGMVLILTLTLSDPFMMSWGWRIPFWVALPLGLIGTYLRTRLADTPEFNRAAEQGELRVPFLQMMAANWRRMLTLVGIVILLNIGYYILLTYLPSYLQTVLKLSATQASVVSIGIYVMMLILIAPVGTLSDRFGRKPMLQIAAAGFFLFSVPCFLLINSHNVVGMTVGLVIMALLLLPMASTIPATLPALFPTRVRYGAFAIGYNVTTSLFGGTAPAIATFLIGATGNNLVPGFYLMAAAVIAAPAVILMPETAKISLSDVGTAREKTSSVATA